MLPVPRVVIVDAEAWAATPNTFRAALAAVEGAEERERILRYHKGAPSTVGYEHWRHTDPKAFVLGRLLLQRGAALARRAPRAGTQSWAWWSDLLADAGAPGAQLDRTAEGRPFCRASAIQLNISHAGPAVALAVDGGSPPEWCGGLVGVDIMPVELVPAGPMSPAATAAFVADFGDFFTADEWLWIRGPGWGARGPDALCLKRFFVMWCLKEALVKALGIGLGFDLGRASFLLSRRDAGAPDFFHSSLGEIPRTPVREQTNPCDVTVQIDGQLAPHWRFLLFEYHPTPAAPAPDHAGVVVGAAAVGPASGISPPQDVVDRAPAVRPAEVDVRLIGAEDVLAGFGPCV